MPRTQAAETAQEATASVMAVVLGGVFVIWSTWVTIIAFTGGAAPLVTFDGPDFGRGLLMLFLGLPTSSPGTDPAYRSTHPHMGV